MFDFTGGLIKPAEWNWNPEFLAPQAERIASMPNFHLLPAWEGRDQPKCPATGKLWTLSGGAGWEVNEHGTALDLTGTGIATIDAPALSASTPISVWFFCQFDGDQSTFARPFEQDFMGVFRRSNTAPFPWEFVRDNTGSGYTVGGSTAANFVSVADILTFGVTSYGDGKFAATYRDGVETNTNPSLVCSNVSAGPFAFGGEPDDPTDGTSLLFRVGFFCHGELTAEDFAYLNENPFGLLQPDPSKIIPRYFTAAASGALEAVPITAQAATIGTPALSQNHALATAGLSAQAATIGAPALGQTHLLDATGLASEPAIVGTPSVGQVHNLDAVGLTSQAATLGTPELSETSGLVAVGITAEPATIGTPALSQNHALDAIGPTASAATVGQPALSQVHALTAAGLVAANATIQTPALIVAGVGDAVRYVIERAPIRAIVENGPSRAIIQRA